MDELEVPTLRTDARTVWLFPIIYTFDSFVFLEKTPLLWAILIALLIGVVVFVGFYWLIRRTSRKRPPLQVTEAGLRLPHTEGHVVEVDWADVRQVRFVFHRLLPQMWVEPVAPERVRPAPNAWQKVAATHRGVYQLRVGLGGDRATRARLRQTVAAHAEVAGKT